MWFEVKKKKEYERLLKENKKKDRKIAKLTERLTILENLEKDILYQIIDRRRKNENST